MLEPLEDVGELDGLIELRLVGKVFGAFIQSNRIHLLIESIALNLCVLTERNRSNSLVSWKEHGRMTYSLTLSCNVVIGEFELVMRSLKIPGSVLLYARVWNSRIHRGRKCVQVVVHQLTTAEGPAD